MYKFIISIHGMHYKIKTRKRIFLFRKQTVIQNVGFYATRFVQAESANTARETVFEIIRNELKNVAEKTDNSLLELSKIQENDEAYDLYAPGEGFTFYLEEDN